MRIAKREEKQEVEVTQVERIVDCKQRELSKNKCHEYQK